MLRGKPERALGGLPAARSSTVASLVLKSPSAVRLMGPSEGGWQSGALGSRSLAVIRSGATGSHATIESASTTPITRNDTRAWCHDAATNVPRTGLVG